MLGLDLVSHPELVATPAVGWQVAACYFQKRAGVLAAADAGDFRRVTLLVNGGYNGWDDRLRYWNKLETLGVVPGSPELKRGARGHEVEVLTRRLSRVKSKKTGKPFLGGPRTKFDLTTARALRAFQREHDLKVDGVLDPRSAAVLQPRGQGAERRHEPSPRSTAIAGRRPREEKPHVERRPTSAPRGSGGGSSALDARAIACGRSCARSSPPAADVRRRGCRTPAGGALERADVQSDALRNGARRAGSRERATRRTPTRSSLGLVRELTALSARLSDVAAERAAAAPEPRPAGGGRAATTAGRHRRRRAGRDADRAGRDAERRRASGAHGDRRPSTIARLEALDAEADTLRATLEARCWRQAPARPPTGPAAPRTRRPSRYLELLATLDAPRRRVRQDPRGAAAGRRRASKARTFRAALARDEGRGHPPLAAVPQPLPARVGGRLRGRRRRRVRQGDDALEQARRCTASASRSPTGRA